MAGDTVEQIKARLSIEEVVKPYVKLARAGRSQKGLCPFHKEKTPSFHVSPERGSWHCFGCGEGGDAFTFIEKIEGVEFKEALKLLAEKAGVKLEYTRGNTEDKDKKERLRALMARATEWYAAKLKGTEAESYAQKRGLTKETVEKWRLGYAPAAWRELLEALTAEGFSTGELQAAGLIKEAEGKSGTYYDRFRDRLMFPIRDHAGSVVAFTGRALAKDDPAKYLNSPETLLYHKSEVLFGFDLAKEAIRRRTFTLLVEGQMDALLCHQAGFENTVALSGTALSREHLARLRRASDNLMLVLDADPAGLTATARSAELALHEGLRVKAARLSGGKDPADLIAANPQTFAACIKNAEPIVEFFLKVIQERERDPHRMMRATEQVVLPLLAAIQSPIERDHFIQSTARALGISPEAVRESLNRLKNSPLRSAEPPSGRRTSPRSARSARQARAEQFAAIVAAYPQTALAERVKNEYSRITEAQVFPEGKPPELAVFLAEKEFGEDPPENAADELLRAFEEAVIREAYKESVGELRRAEAAGDAAAIKRAEAACVALGKRLTALGLT